MHLLTTRGWDEYALIDCGEGRRLEQFGKYLLNRPDPQALWHQQKKTSIWDSAHAIFSDKIWKKNPIMPDSWLIHWHKLAFSLRLTPFKHTGMFPEQHVQWEWMQKQLEKKQKAQVLNLFAYTGSASVACAASGARVTHVDASRPSLAWAKENQSASQLSQDSIRWILDDALSFVAREARRNNHYDAIIMDPPVYGHGPHGERWDFAKSFPLLLNECKKLLAPKPLFILVNAYAISVSSLMLQNIMADIFGETLPIQESGELVLEEKDSGRPLSTGIYSRISC